MNLNKYVNKNLHSSVMYIFIAMVQCFATLAALYFIVFVKVPSQDIVVVTLVLGSFYLFAMSAPALLIKQIRIGKKDFEVRNLYGMQSKKYDRNQIVSVRILPLIGYGYLKYKVDGRNKYALFINPFAF